MKFKHGDKAYSLFDGLVNVEIGAHPVYSVEAGTKLFLPDGRLDPDDLNPTLLTLEEARAKGYEVPKQKVVKTIEKWVNVYFDGIGLLHDSVADADDMDSGRITRVKLTGTYEVEE